MIFCPECGRSLSLDGVDQDVATDHYAYHCEGGHCWVETVTKGGDLVHITEGEEPGWVDRGCEI